VVVVGRGGGGVCVLVGYVWMVVVGRVCVCLGHVWVCGAWEVHVDGAGGMPGGLTVGGLRGSLVEPLQDHHYDL
jgi:hypothetical protein